MDEFWEDFAKWLAGIISGLVVTIGTLIRAWAGHRFKKQDERIEKVEADVTDVRKEVSDNKNSIGQLGVHMEHIKQDTTTIREDSKEGFRLLHEKLDKIVDRRG